MRQDHLFDALPLADLWGDDYDDPRPPTATDLARLADDMEAEDLANDRAGGMCPMCDRWTTDLFCSDECRDEYGRLVDGEVEDREKPDYCKEAEDVPAKAPSVPSYCLKCGKATLGGSFCSGSCKRAWQRSMGSWANRYNSACDEADRSAGAQAPSMFGG
jgi:hypothetical protein